MIQNNTKEENLRTSMFGRMHLTPENEKIARAYLDMENEENPALLADVNHQDLTGMFPMNGYPEYLKWLRKNKRTEELSRYVRFVVELGGATAWKILANDNYEARLSDVEPMLACLTGAHAEEQKTAVRAALCAKILYKEYIGNLTEDAVTLLKSGEKDPEIFRRALDYCYPVEEPRAHGRHHARMLLTAAYLYWKEPKAAPELTRQLEEDLIADIEIMVPPARAYSQSELQCLQNYVRTAQRDTPFPQNVLAICKARQGWMSVRFHAACTFLALNHSERFEILFRLMLGEGFRDIYRIEPLKIARGIAGEKDFCAKMDKIQEMLPLQDEDYIIWCLYGEPAAAGQGEPFFLYHAHADCDAEVRRMAVRCPDGIRAAVKKADSEEYRKLTALVQHANPTLLEEIHEEMHASHQEVYLEKMADRLVNAISTLLSEESKEPMKQYLLGKLSLDALIPKIRQNERNSFAYLHSIKYDRINHLKKLNAFSFYRRALILESFFGKPDFLKKYFVSEEIVEEPVSGVLLYDKQQISALLDIFAKENVPAGMQLTMLGAICYNVEDKKDKIHFQEACAEAVAERRQPDSVWEEGIAEALRQGNALTCSICLKVLAQREAVAPYKKQLFELVDDSTEQLQKELLEIFKKQTAWESDILALLASRKQKQRTFAVMVLEEWEQPSHLEDIKAALAKEKSKKIAARLQTLAEELEKAGTEDNTPKTCRTDEERLAAEIYKGSRKRKVEWVQSISFPCVHFQHAISNSSEAESGNSASDEQPAASPAYMLAILASYADMEILGINQDAKRLAAPLVPQELAAYVHALYNGWLAAGADAKTRWVLYAAAIHGDAGLISILHRQLKDWAEHARGAIAAEAVRAIALNGSAQALLLVDQMSRKFKSNQIKNAAKKALDDAASALGITRETLEDRIVPDLGFSAQLAQTFDYGARTFTVRLTPQLALEIYDGSGRQLKKLPLPGKQDDSGKAAQAQEAFKQLKKQLKLVVEAQKLRLEQVLITARYWQTEVWTELFVGNPVMHQFAVGLIWGIYENGALQTTFRYMEDGSFNTVEEQEYELPQSAVIGLVHPLELTEELLNAWKEQLSDYEITQPVEQLERPVYHVAREENGTQQLTRFYGREINGMSLSGKLLRQGWVRGEILDAGFFDNYYRSDSAFGAELTFSGCSVGYENEDVTVQDLCFTKVVSSTPRKEKPCTLDEVDARYFSEIVLQIARILGE